MGYIANYAQATAPSLTDKVIGTDVDNNNATKNFTIQDILGLGGVPLTNVLSAEDVAVSQGPSTTNSLYQVVIGAAQGTVSDPVMLDASGNITFNQAGTYLLIAQGCFGRTSGGASALMHFAAFLDGVQEAATQSVGIKDAGDKLPYERTVPIVVTAGQVLTFKISRDSAFDNEGSLVSSTDTDGLFTITPNFKINILKVK
jgi:hypothetical protein